MKRIKPDEIVTAFEKTGLQPKRGFYYQREDELDPNSSACACGLGAWYAHKQGENDINKIDESVAQLCVDENFSIAYRTGFARGFDGDEKGTVTFFNQQDYYNGYEDGKAAWEAVNQKILSQQEDTHEANHSG